MTDEYASEVTRLLIAADDGDEAAMEQVFPLVYEDLRRVAGNFLGRERAGHTLQPTALVHEAFLRLTGGEDPGFQGRRHFFAIAAQAMRRILVDHARSRKAKKRGSGRPKVSLDRLPQDPAARDECLLDLDDALGELAALDPRKAKLVELRFFGGLTIEEAGESLGISHATVERDWTFARAWLARAMQPPDQMSEGTTPN